MDITGSSNTKNILILENKLKIVQYYFYLKFLLRFNSVDMLYLVYS